LEEEFAALREVVMNVTDNAATTTPRETASLNTGEVKIKIEEPSELDTATATSTAAVTTTPTTPSTTPNEGCELDHDIDALLASNEQGLQGIRAQLGAIQEELRVARTE
jgi:hypothetical protein